MPALVAWVVLLGGVTRRHVPDFVPQHASQLRLAVEKRHDAAREIDIAARQRECVDGRHVYHREVPGKIRAFRGARQTQADVFDVPLEFGVVVDAHLPPHFGIHLLTELNLLRLAHQREFPLTGRRIRRARREQRHRRDNGYDAWTKSMRHHRCSWREGLQPTYQPWCSLTC